ncbi:MAG: hypothetical protein SOY63_03160 [Alloprevotella sp.]|nr:hypothetical protein [Alloprevotella sp.]
MRKFYLFFALLIGISGAAWAKNFTPEKGAIYTIRNKKHGTFALYNSGCKKDGTNILSTWAQFDQRSFFIIEGNADTGYTLRFKNEPTRYVMAVNTKDENSNVGTITIDGGEVPDSAKWKIVESEAGKGTWNIIPFEGSRGWNQRGELSGNLCVGQWESNNTDDNRWYIQKPTEMAPGSSVTDNSSNTVGFPTQEWLETGIPAHNAATTLEEEFTPANAAAFYTAWTASSLPVSLVTPTQPASGLFKIKNAGTGKYLFQSEENNAKGLTLLNDGGDNSKYYWTANFSGNDVTLKGSLGQAPKRGRQNVVYANIAGGIVMNTITMEGAPSGSADYTENTFLWPDVHSTTSFYYTINHTDYNSATNPAFLTTYATTDAADQYVFEPVTFSAGEQIYRVSVDRSIYNSDANVTLNDNNYKGNKTVHDGGFYVLSAAPSASDFTADDANGNEYYNAVVTIDGTTIKVAYELNVELAEDYVNASTAKKVGYPTPTSTVATELKAALETYKSAETEENLATLSTKLTAYMNATTDITMPVDGKAYTFTQVDYDGTKRYMKYAEAGMELSSTASKATVFVCRKVADGQYAFVNNDGKYLAWKGNGSDGKNGANGGKGYVNSFDYAEDGDNDWANIAIAKLTAGNASDNKVGYVCLGGRRYLTSSNDMTYKRSCIIIKKSTGDFDASSETATGITQYFNANFSSAFLIEDATYANVVSLKDASGLESGKNIATFSAPFPTVVPENTTAYTVETTSGTNVTKVALQEAVTAGNAIPANQGVILIGTATGNVTMLPRTTEAITEIANNGLSHTAGAAADVNDGNSYVLADKSQGWAFYKVSTAATSQLPKNKAYLHLTAASETIRFDFGNATGIDNIDADNKAESKIYDLSGRAVKTMGKGLYIVDGKKVIK